LEEDFGMKRKLILIVMAVVLVIGITACGTSELSNNALDNENDTEQINDEKDTDKDKIEYELTEEGIINPEFAEKIIKEISNKVINAISTKHFYAISEIVHPAKGVRFTPYTYVSVDNDVVFNIEKIESFLSNQDVYLWGQYDGTGFEISLTPNEYYDKFIYTEDFLYPEEIGYNEVLSRGNMLENQFEVYENAIVVEYYFSGFNPEYEGIDWRSLRLVFEEYEGEWKLVGVIHNQWTI